MKDSNYISAKKNSDFYENFWGNSYRSGHSGFDKRRGRIIRELARKYFNKSVKPRILDHGCGSGWLVKYLHLMGVYVGVDYSIQSIDLARKAYSRYGTYYTMDDFRVNASSLERFDIVISSEVIEHTLDHKEYIKELYGYLNESGLLILTTPNGNLWPAYSNYVKTFNCLQPIENWIRPEDLHILFSNQFNILNHFGLRDKIFYVGNIFKDNYLIDFLMGFNFIKHAEFERRKLATALYQILCAQKQ